MLTRRGIQAALEIASLDFSGQIDVSNDSFDSNASAINKPGRTASLSSGSLFTEIPIWNLEPSTASWISPRHSERISER
ncbi:MAG: hypothetical protein O7C39_01955 [Bacteroidetes bacterium]|nr:hypothetical protein [Bacteroidota bacterium]